MRVGDNGDARRLGRAGKIGVVSLLLPFPAIWLTEAGLIGGGLGDPVQILGTCAPLVGYPMVVGTWLRWRFAREGVEAVAGRRFADAPRLRLAAAFARALLTAALLAIPGVAVLLVILAGFQALFGGGSLSIDNQPLGALGEGFLAMVLCFLLAAGAWLILGSLTYAVLAIGNSLRRLRSRSSSTNQRSDAVMIILATFIVAGVAAVVVGGNSPLLGDDVLARGLLATGGAAFLVLGTAAAIVEGERRGTGFRAAQLNGPGVVLRVIAGLALLGWLVTSVVQAWQP